MEAIDMTAGGVAKLTAKHELLQEAQKRGLDLNQRNATTGETLRQEIERQGETVGKLTDQYDAAEARAESFTSIQQEVGNAFIDAAIEGQNLSGMLEDLAKSLARAAMQAAILGEGPLAGMFGNASSGGLIGMIANSFAGPRPAAVPRWLAGATPGTPRASAASTARAAS